MATDIEHVAYFKIETAGAASKLAGADPPRRRRDRRSMGRRGGDHADAGATGAMTGGGYPDGIREIVDAYRAGRRAQACDLYQRWLPLINYENRQCGLLACKALMKEGGVIECEAPRHPLSGLHPATRADLIETARRLDPLVLRWGPEFADLRDADC